MNHVRRIASYSFRYWERLLLSGITAVLFGLFSAVPTWGLGKVVDIIFVNRQEHLLPLFIFLFFVLFMFKGLFMYASNYYMQWVGNMVVNDIRRDLFKKIIYYPPSFFKSKATGDLMSYFLSDISMIQSASSSAIRNGVRSFFEALGSITVAFLQNWKLAFLMLLLGPCIAYSINRMGKYMRSTARQTQNRLGNLSAVLQEIFIGVREIKSFNAEELEINRFNSYLNSYFGTIMKNVRIVSLTPAFIEILTMSGISCIFYVAAHQVLHNTITPGQLASFFAALLFAYQPMKRLINVYADLQSGIAAAGRVFEVMDLEKNCPEKYNNHLSSFTHEIRFSNVSFRYTLHAPVLNNLSFSIKKGERLGIIGPSGTGKSTLCDLMLGFIEPTTGIISIDGYDISSLSRSSLRNQISYVSQQPFLFNDTILANIQYGHPEASFEAVIQACSIANAHTFISELPYEYNTIVGENGCKLSGGQKQRITIARALLKNADIILFDEATSALDVQSEQMIQQALQSWCKNKTVIIISHRLSFLEQMDRIFSLTNNQIIEHNRVTIVDTSSI